jgi:predicted ferric reductase
VHAGGAPAGAVLHELADACGFLALAILGLQFATTARFRWLEPPAGTDLVYAVHRQVTFVAIGLALLHPALLFGPRLADVLAAVNPAAGPWELRAGSLSLAAVALVAATSLLRRRLRLPYEAWRALHGALAVGAVALAAWHALALGSALQARVPRLLWAAYTASFLALALRVRVVKPALLRRRPWTVEAVVKQRGDVVSLRLRPRGHRGFRFAAGQFAWISVGDSPFAGREHPFSFSGAAGDAPLLEVSIKDAGDWTRRVQSLAPGATAFVDGPFGTLCVDRHPDAAGFGFVAGGIGVAPFLSHLRTLAARGERRPLVLVYGSGAWETTTFREELAELATRLRLRLVHVVARPEPGWTGERGLPSRELLERHVPAAAGWEWFVCGPPAMMDVVERALHDLGVPVGRIHSERFDLV